MRAALLALLLLPLVMPAAADCSGDRCTGTIAVPSTVAPSLQFSDPGPTMLQFSLGNGSQYPIVTIHPGGCMIGPISFNAGPYGFNLLAGQDAPMGCSKREK